MTSANRFCGLRVMSSASDPDHGKPVCALFLLTRLLKGAVSVYVYTSKQFELNIVEKRRV